MKKNLLNAELKAQAGEVYLKINLRKDISKLFKPDKNPEIRQSTSWQTKDGQPLKYYHISSDYSNEKRLQNFEQLPGYSVKFNSFGYSLIGDRGRYINASILRAVNIDKGITLKLAGDYTADELKLYCARLGKLIEQLYKAYFIEIKINLTIEEKQR